MVFSGVVVHPRPFPVSVVDEGVAEKLRLALEGLSRLPENFHEGNLSG